MPGFDPVDQVRVLEQYSIAVHVEIDLPRMSQVIKLADTSSSDVSCFFVGDKFFVLDDLA